MEARFNRLLEAAAADVVDEDEDDNEFVVVRLSKLPGDDELKFLLSRLFDDEFENLRC